MYSFTRALSNAHVQISKGVFTMKFTVSMVIFFVLFLGLAHGQGSVSLTLEKSVDLALEKNTQVIQAQNTVSARQSSVQSAIGNLLPSLDASGSYSNIRNWTPVSVGRTQFIPGYGNLSLPSSGGFSLSESYSTGLDSRIVLFNGFANYANVRRSKADASSSEYNLSRTQQSTVLQTHSLFLNVVRTYKLLKVNEDNLKRSKRQLERITESNKVGSVALADVYRQRVQAGNDELNLIRAQSDHEKAKADLIAFLGIDYNNEYTFDFTGIPVDIDTTEFTSINARYSDFNGLVSTATEKRPDYQASIENLNSAEASVSAATAGYFPTVSASGSFGYRNSTLSTLTDNRDLTVSVSVSLPIFNGFSTQNQIEQTQVARQNADEQLKQSQRQIRVDVRKALLDLESSEKQVNVTQTSVESADMDRKIAEEKYNLGAGTLLDLLVATANYTTALSNKVNAVTNYLLAKKQTEFSLGIITK